MHQQLYGYKVEKELYLGVRERTRLNIADTEHAFVQPVFGMLRDLRERTVLLAV